MYTLRRVSSDGIEMNFNLGDSYTFVEKEKNPKEFKRMINEVLNGEISNTCYAFVSYNGGQIHFLHKDQRNYIMTESGVTFSNLTL